MIVLPQFKWSEVEDIKQVERMWIRPSLNDIFDLDWSPDSVYIVIGALEGKVSLTVQSSVETINILHLV